ncbi:MAG TPA: NAD(P)-dependent alcohol dehydrogenase [Chloroflexi bacterium]|jgi:NADPH:quinone reductase-like Zn-dependent oxidoreductase|nr:NAD(P)-dependent alcohol dehydrogenase [Chloroflexota bacterium]HAL26028.1 NAD(P)-dependent alcohol dehydrogenase [Chloroflexota bacterium]
METRAAAQEATTMDGTVALNTARTMTAVVQEGQGSADVLQIRQIPVPQLRDDQLLVRVHAASVNAFDYGLVRAGWLVTVFAKLLGRRVRLQGVRGVDLSGTVEAVGRNVTAFRPGDDVMGVGTGSWAEYASATERGLVSKPTNISYVEAAAVGNAGVTALQAVRDHGKVRAGQRVLVYGAGGGVGTFTVQIAKAFGGHVTAVTSTRNIEVVRSLAPDALLDYTRDDITKRPERYDVVFDVAGTRPLGELLRVLAPGGRVVMVGAAKGGAGSLVARLVAGLIRARVLRQPILICTASFRHEDLAVLKDLIESGKVRPAIDRTFSLAEVREAVRYTMDGQGRAKVVITIA